MSVDLTLPERDDARVIWVFTADLDRPGFAAFTKAAQPWPVAEALGLPGLGPGSVETFLAEDLADYGLDRYLTEAHGMAPASVAPDASRLASLHGPVLLLFSRDLPGAAGRIDPQPPLTFVGRYDAPYHLAAPVPFPASPSARGHVDGPAGPGADATGLGRVLVLTLVAFALLALLVVALA